MTTNQPITFAKAEFKDLALMTSWWKDRPHILEFWDNSDSMWQNCYNYLCAKKDEFDYWIASLDSVPFALVMSSDISQYVDEKTAERKVESWFQFVPKEGTVVGFDFMIAEPTFLQKGLAPVTLKAFKKFLEASDSSISAFYIDPDPANVKAVRAYSNAGFEIVGTFVRDFDGQRDVPHVAMVCPAGRD